MKFNSLKRVLLVMKPASVLNHCWINSLEGPGGKSCCLAPTESNYIRHFHYIPRHPETNH